MITAPHPQVQAPNVDFSLHTLGWKAFQDLATAVAAQVLRRPVQTFLPSRDGGRDGAFVGTWTDGGATAKSTIQCKFMSKAGATLSLSDLTPELAKIPKLAGRGLAEDYVVMTNAGVSGEAEARIVEAVTAAGAKAARVFGRDWITERIRTEPKLRMLVPRLYGLGDLSQIIDERAYAQARHILSSMGDDLAAFVTTDAHRRSVDAIGDHRFVLLLGDPASGKSTIGASLAIGALDDGAIGTVRVTSADSFEQHWNPLEPDQFFWIDDAFGETQYQRGRVDGWNARLRLLRAAVKAGARVLMTSRTYIWREACRDLKLSDFPLLKNSQVIIDVQGLAATERAQILYNHLHLGDQPQAWRRRLKPLLPAVSTNPAFLPETARRLGSRFFTEGLSVTAGEVERFVEEPVVFLTEVLVGLDAPARAAVALIFLHGVAGVSSPVQPSAALDVVLRLTGVSATAVTGALETLGGSLTMLVESDAGPRWTFKHPTVADAYAALVAGSPELVELYIRGAKRERLLTEVVCAGAPRITGAAVTVPPSQYPTLMDRLVETGWRTSEALRFLALRADPPFLRRFLETAPDIRSLASAVISDMRWSNELNVLTRLHEEGFLDDEVRQEAVARITALSIEWADGAVFRNKDIRSLFTPAELDALVQSFRTDILEEYGPNPSQWDGRLVSGDKAQHLRDLQEGIEAFGEYHLTDGVLTDACREAVHAIEERIAEVETEEDDDAPSRPTAPAAPTRQTRDIAAIFDDVDD